MIEYIDRAEAMELLSQPIVMSMCLSLDECHNKRAQQRIDRYLIEGIPAADVRHVVLCKDCKHRPAKKDGRIRAPEDADGYTDYNCPFVCDDSWYNRMPADDDYCSRGEKREES